MPKDLNPDRSGDKQNIRVLMIGPDRSVHGGISGVVNNLYEAGLDKDIDVDYIGTMKDGSRIKKLFVAAGAYLRFCRMISGYDIVHVNVASDNSYRRKAFFIKKAKKSGKKILIHQHGGEWEKYYAGLSDTEKKKVGKIFGLADVFMSVSASHKEFFEKTVGLKSVKLFPNTIKVPELKDRSFDSHRIIFLGRICREKGIFELIDAVTALKGKFPDTELILAGICDDPELKKLIEDNAGCIRFTGWVSGKDKERLMEETDIFAIPSYFEGLPVSVLETMASGMCVVASDVGGIPMLIKNDETGILVKPHDKDDLLRGLEAIMSDPLKAKRLAQSGYEFVKEHYNIDNTISELVEIYKGLLNE